MTRFLPLIATLIVLAVNAAASLVPINGYSTGELSALYPTGFTPSGWAFSIWSLIYLGLLAFSCASMFGALALRTRASRILVPYLLNAAGNAGWIFAWHYRLVALSVVLMLGILATLVVITTRLRRMARPSVAEWFTIDAPMSLYFGWITAATLVNVGTLFYAWQSYPFALTMEQWALVSVAFATAIYVWMAATTRDLVYCAVFVWVALAIAYRPVGIEPSVKIVALTGLLAVGIAMLWALFARWRVGARDRLARSS